MRPAGRQLAGPRPGRGGLDIGLGPILLLTGLEPEARSLARALSLPRRPGVAFPAFGGGAIRVAAVGLGASALEARWPEIAAGWARALVVSAGVCGALDPALSPGDLVVAERVIGAGGEVLEVTASARRTALARLGATAPPRTLATVDRVLDTPELKAACRLRTGAAAVDMESAVIVARAGVADWPTLVIRAVSDGAGEAVPRALASLVGPDGRVRAGRAALLALSSPGLIRDGVRLRRGTQLALAAVASAVAALVAARA